MPFTTEHLPFEQTNSFPRLFLDYVKGEKKLDKFYSHRPDIGGFKKAIEELSAFPFERQLLVDVLKDQYAAASLPAPSSLSHLTSDKTYTVCTGHQLCLFTGPLYFIYKIISTINLAEELKKAYPQNEFVPVYWMASEDHDVEEIDHLHLFGKKLKWETDQKGAVGNFKLNDLKPLLEELRVIMGESERAKEIFADLADTYSHSLTLAIATRKLVHDLFSEYGLVVLDGNDPRLKKQFVPYFKDDLQDHTNFKLVNETIAELKTAGYEAQVTPREINVFKLEWHDRVRVEKADAEMIGEVSMVPEKFSPNVVLRPLYQQMILPNLAYVGGPGEISYWLEYQKMFAHHKLFFPVLVPRASVMWMDVRSAETLDKLKLLKTDLFHETEQLLKEAALKNTSVETSMEQEAVELKKLYDLIGIKLSQSDATLKASVEAEMQKAMNGIKNLEGKLVRAEKQKQETSLNQLRKLKEKFFPEGKLQERHDNFIPFYIKHGKEFISVLKKELDPLELKFTIISES
jgi:bacillithiol biosynthesis cysteine-adding enzyme BshC